MQTKALIFDVFGTIVDWRRGVSEYCTPIFDEKQIEYSPTKFAELWRAEYTPSMKIIRQGNRGYVPLDQLHLENLKRVLDRTSLASYFSEAELEHLNKAWEHLSPWPDCVAGLTHLKSKFTIAPCSNGSISLMSILADFGGLPWDDYVGAEIAQNYKPHPQVYLKSAKHLGLQPEEVMMVAAHNYDLGAARQCGLKTAFFARPTEHGEGQTIDLTAESDWDYVAKDLADLADTLCG